MKKRDKKIIKKKKKKIAITNWKRVNDNIAKLALKCF